MILTSQIIKPYISGLHLGSYTYLFSNILDHTISRTQTLELIEKNPKLYIQNGFQFHKSYWIISDILHNSRQCAIK